MMFLFSHSKKKGKSGYTQQTKSVLLKQEKRELVFGPKTQSNFQRNVFIRFFSINGMCRKCRLNTPFKYIL